MYHAVMEGVVFALNDSISVLEDLGIDIQGGIASGGGAASELWLQMQADIFNREITTTASSEQANLGAVILSAVGCGIYRNIEEACSVMVKPGDRKAWPIKENAQIYQERYRKYKSLYLRISDLY